MSGSKRNQPCYCGSGQKYKKCHLLLESKQINHSVFGLKEAKVHEIHKTLSENYKEEMCLADNINRSCSENIVNAHTVPRSSSLNMIAEKGHVYTFKALDFIHLKKNYGTFQPKKVGVQTASTFKGFCSIHDNLLFNCLEKESIRPTSKQCFMLLYRAYSMEFYNKKVQNIQPNKFLKHILPIANEDQFLLAKSFYDFSAHPMAIAQDEFQKYYTKLQSNLRLENYSSANYYAIELKGILPFMCSGSFGIEENIDGHLLQDFCDYNQEIEYISLSIFTDKAHVNWIIFSWLSDHDRVNQKFINSLDDLPHSDKIKICLNIMLKYLENFYFNIPYWDDLSENIKNDVIDKFNSTAFTPYKWNIKDPIMLPINNVEVSRIVRS